MYGLILENMSEFIKQAYGEDKWEEIRRTATVDQPSFSVHQVYPENLIPRLAKSAIQILGVTEELFFDQMGVHFVRFVSQYGYDRVLSVLGRHMRDFLNGLDNLHEYLKFSYPRMKAPSFICENETRQGLTLHYRSKRRGFVYYTMGQIRELVYLVGVLATFTHCEHVNQRRRSFTDAKDPSPQSQFGNIYGQFYDTQYGGLGNGYNLNSGLHLNNGGQLLQDQAGLNLKQSGFNLNQGGYILKPQSENIGYSNFNEPKQNFASTGTNWKNGGYPTINLPNNGATYGKTYGNGYPGLGDIDLSSILSTAVKNYNQQQAQIGSGSSLHSQNGNVFYIPNLKQQHSNIESASSGSSLFQPQSLGTGTQIEGLGTNLAGKINHVPVQNSKTQNSNVESASPGSNLFQPQSHGTGHGSQIEDLGTNSAGNINYFPVPNLKIQHPNIESASSGSNQFQPQTTNSHINVLPNFQTNFGSQDISLDSNFYKPKTITIQGFEPASAQQQKVQPAPMTEPQANNVQHTQSKQSAELVSQFQPIHVGTSLGDNTALKSFGAGFNQYGSNQFDYLAGGVIHEGFKTGSGNGYQFKTPVLEDATQFGEIGIKESESKQKQATPPKSDFKATGTAPNANQATSYSFNNLNTASHGSYGQGSVQNAFKFNQNGPHQYQNDNSGANSFKSNSFGRNNNIVVERNSYKPTNFKSEQPISFKLNNLVPKEFANDFKNYAPNNKEYSFNLENKQVKLNAYKGFPSINYNLNTNFGENVQNAYKGSKNSNQNSYKTFPSKSHNINTDFGETVQNAYKTRKNGNQNTYKSFPSINHNFGENIQYKGIKNSNQNTYKGFPGKIHKINTDFRENAYKSSNQNAYKGFPSKNINTNFGENVQTEYKVDKNNNQHTDIGPKEKGTAEYSLNMNKDGSGMISYVSVNNGDHGYTYSMRHVARHFYHKEMKIELCREELLFDMVHVTFELTFDNRAFTLASLAMTREEKHLPISASVLFEIFPFCIVFGSDMIVRSIGNSLMVILPDLLGKKITNWFDLVRPLITFKFQTILNRTNNIFELVSVDPVLKELPGDKRRNEVMLSKDFVMPEEKNIRLKGQMIYMDNWKMMMYLGTPVMPDLNSLISSGLYINDLSMHDFSRDLMLAGTQQSVELKLALDQEQQKSKKLEESMKKLDEEMRRTDELLYQMIPKQVADRLRRGENPIDTCEMFDSVTVLFSDVVTFTEICSRITPMEVVSMLNAMYSIFDTLTERNKVYKVETIGDAYMVVCGAPDKDPDHAQRVCDMAMDMVEAITDLKDPSTGTHLRIRVGVHSGAVVAGIVGLKMPRYCLFGDSVNTASRMESTSEAMKIHISQSTKELISNDYHVTERGEIQVKGKGSMKTYWLKESDCRLPVEKMLPRLPELPASPERENSAETPTCIVREAILTTAEDRRVYSPVTFQDVARRSIANSPVKSASLLRQRESRSNSMGAAYISSPSELFGSEINDYREVTATPSSSTISGRTTPNLYLLRHSTAPTKMQANDFNRLTSPPCTAPAFVNIRHGMMLTTTDRRVDILKVNHDDIDYSSTTDLPGTSSPPTSKSDGDLLTVTNREIVNNLPNSHSDMNMKQHQQCCAGFGSAAAKNRNHANGCELI